jgi:hypothetical protein
VQSGDEPESAREQKDFSGELGKMLTLVCYNVKEENSCFLTKEIEFNCR